MEIFYAITGLVNAITSTALGIFVYSRDRKNIINKTFTLFCVTAAVWSFGYYFWLTSTNKIDALFWIKILMMGAIFIPPTYFHFVLSFLKELSVKKYLIITTYLFFAVFGILNFDSLIVKDTIEISFFKYWPVPGAGFHLFLIVWLFYVIYTSFLLFEGYKGAERERKLQIKYLFWGIAIGFVGGSTNYFLWYKIPIPPIGNILVIFYVIFTAYAVVKHHLMSVKVIAAELFTLAIVFILFVNIFIAPTTNLRILYSVIFGAVSFFGYLLIKSVLREVRQREEIERLAVGLETANKRLAKLDKEKSEFLSIATHQLRTPMTIVKGYISMIFEGTFGQFSEKAKEALAKVYTSNERLIKLIDDLLNISRIERGKMEYDFQLLALEKLVADVVTELKPVAERKNLKLVWQAPEGLPKIKFDEGKMRQVVLNLIDNAIKYTEKGEIELKMEKKNGKVLLSVKDTGIGIAKEKIPFLFKRYARLESKSPYTQHTQGMGLGLYVAKRIIDDHQGKIWAESEGPAKGSTFFVELSVG